MRRTNITIRKATRKRTRQSKNEGLVRTMQVEKPQLSVSTGAVVYAKDGASIERLLGTADRALYGAKTLTRGSLPMMK